MSDATHILQQIEQGDPSAAEQLLPLVYDELRRLAASKLANEKPGQTLQATALVHEAYIRLVDAENAQKWDSRGHFFAAAAEAMRRILVENARRKDRLRHGGGGQRLPLCEEDVAVGSLGEELLDLDDAISKLAAVDPQSAELVKLRVFAGLTVAEAGEILGIPERTARRNWAYARVWIRRQVEGNGRPMS